MNWRLRAACRDDDAEVYFPRRYSERAVAQARGTCRGCVVQDECLDLALAVPEPFDRFGVYAGLTPAERDDLRNADASVTYDEAPNAYGWLRGGPPEGTRPGLGHSA